MKRMTKKDKLLFAGIAVVAAAAILIAVYLISGGYAVTVHLSDYTSLGRNADNEPIAVLDIDAILTDLRLPNPKYGNIRKEDYPDVNALCNLQLLMVYDTMGDEITLSVTGDFRTLLLYGIQLQSVLWTQSLRGTIAEDSSQVSPMTTPEPPGESISFPTPYARSNSHVEIGYLHSPVDLDGYGLNMRPVLERIHTERDKALQSMWSSADASIRKVSAFFVYAKEADTFHNLYRTVYYTKNNITGAVNWFTITVYDLEWTEQSAVAYARTAVQSFRTEGQAADRMTFENDAYDVYTIDGSSVIQSGRVAFDPYGFVRFPQMPTGYKLPSGQIWSPSYDLLEEDYIWQLTGADGYSMEELLCYVRKEIGARTGQAFDPVTETAFHEHFSMQSWYEPLENWNETFLTQEQQENILLLLEIENLISN